MMIKEKGMSNHELRELRRMAGLTQAQLGELLGVSVAWVNHREAHFTHKRYIRIDAVEELLIRNAIRRYCEKKKTKIDDHSVHTAPMPARNIKRPNKSPLEGFEIFTGKALLESKIHISKHGEILIPSWITTKYNLDRFSKISYFSKDCDVFAIKFHATTASKHSYSIQKKGTTCRAHIKAFADSNKIPLDSYWTHEWHGFESVMVLKSEEV